MISRFKKLDTVSPLLSSCIDCFYILESDDDSFRSIHNSFPHTYNAVSIYSGATLELEHDVLYARGNRRAAITCVLQGKRQSPLRVVLEGKIKRVTIIFKPLGLNHFMPLLLGHVMKPQPVYFTCWDSPDFTQTVSALFTETSLTAQMHQLEAFLCRMYRPLDLQPLALALRRLENFETECPINELAASAGMPLRTFNRIFLQHLGISPVAYRRIARFRSAMEMKLFEETQRKLTDIGYHYHFYDQPELVRQFRQLSGTSPSALLRSVQRLGDSRLVFQFL